jgi:hypothetical protein
VVEVLDPLMDARWCHQFEPQAPGRRDRRIEEGIWRRTQGPENAGESGWRSPGDARRRVVHYHYRFRVVDGPDVRCLAVTSLYLFQSLSVPRDEMDEFRERIRRALAGGGWSEQARRWVRGDLVCTITHHRDHPVDVRAGRRLPAGYTSLDVTVESRSCVMPDPRRQLPWEVLARGIRPRDRRGNPTVIPDLGALAGHLPIQVELGCGISIEAAIPPLHVLHDWYSVTDPATGAFIFGGERDTLMSDLLGDPDRHLRLRAQMMLACLHTEPTPGHRVLRVLTDRRLLLGPVMTNNFDGLHARVGLDECYLRRYDDAAPDIPIHPDANALLVIGCHADRRRVQARFRARGLPIFYLDPEGFDGHDGQFVPYPVEGARDGDRIRRAGATAGLLELAQELDLHALH